MGDYIPRGFRQPRFYPCWSRRETQRGDRRGLRLDRIASPTRSSCRIYLTRLLSDRWATVRIRECEDDAQTEENLGHRPTGLDSLGDLWFVGHGVLNSVYVVFR